MNENTAKIRFKIGQLEIEYEGREYFLKNDLSNLLNEMVGFSKEHSATQFADTSPYSKEDVTSTDKDYGLDFSTTTFASRMKATTGTDLAMAASAHLTLVKGKKTFTRADIRTEMKEATSYYKTSMTSNLSASLKSLVKSNHLNETASGTYALTANEKDRIEKLLD